MRYFLIISLILIAGCTKSTKKDSGENKFSTLDKALVDAQRSLTKGDYKKFDKLIQEVFIQSKAQNDSLILGRAHSLCASRFFSFRNDSAYYHILKAEKIFLRVGDSAKLGNNYIEKAFVQLAESDYFGVEISAIQGLAYLRNSVDYQSKYDAYNLIGISSNELKNYENAILYHEKALQLAIERNLAPKFFLKVNSLNNIGVVYQNLGDYKTSIKYFESALEDANLERDDPALYSMIIDNLAYSKLKIGRFKDVERFLLKALKIRVRNQLTSGLVINKIHLSEFYAEVGDTTKAIGYAKEALYHAKKVRTAGDILQSLKHLAVLDKVNSASHSKEYIRISDSILLGERLSKDKFARIAYETGEISLQKDKLAEQNRNLLYFFVGFLMIGLLLFVIRSQRARNRELLLIQAQQKANEDIYNLMISQQNRIEESRIREKKRIAQELHDGVLGRLFGTRLNLDSLNKMTDDEAVTRRVEYLNELKNIEQDIREISHDLNREKYALINNFLAILNNLLEEQKASFNTQVTCEIDEDIDWDKLSNTIKINLYRIVQEALQNMNKYAQATKVKIAIKASPVGLTLVIADNGIGFDTNLKRKGIGIQNMNSRANEMQATLDIQSKKGKGTTLTVEIPVR